MPSPTAARDHSAPLNAMQRRNFLSCLLAAFVPPVVGRAAQRPIDPDPSKTPLSTWLRHPIQPVWDSPNPHLLDHPLDPIDILLHCIHERNQIAIHYLGGSRPGSERLISPALLFRKLKPAPSESDPTYLLAWCHRRNELRTFRVDRIDFGFPLDKPLP